MTFNFLANVVQETLVARIAERLLINLRRAMYLHLQRVSLSFMDKTQVGPDVALQGDVHALQEFLETSVFAIGDLVLLVGITIALLVLDWRLGLLTLSVVPILVVVRLLWLPRAGAPSRARVTSSTLNGALPKASTASAPFRGWVARSTCGSSKKRWRTTWMPSYAAPGWRRSWCRSSTP